MIVAALVMAGVGRIPDAIPGRLVESGLKSSPAKGNGSELERFAVDPLFKRPVKPLKSEVRSQTGYWAFIVTALFPFCQEG